MHFINLLLFTASLTGVSTTVAHPTNNFTIRADDASDQSWPKKPASPPANPPGLEDCYWAGHWPFCMPKCGYGYKKVKQDECGDGHCCWMGKKSLCCVIPPPAKAPGGDDGSRGDHDHDNDNYHYHDGNEDDDY